LRVPEDVSIVGFDDHDLAEVMELTTIQQPVVGSGQLAGKFLLGSIESVSGSNAAPIVTKPAPIPHEVMPTELVVRRTTAPRR
jgi:LacI family transcriptional regulator, repressor for deo operon, udp, cdd, tsx, nupC, and nupG